MQIECHDSLDEGLARKWQAFLDAARHQHPRQSPLFAPSEAALGRRPLFALGRVDGAVRAVALLSLVPHPFLPGTWSQAFCLSGPVCDDAGTMRDFLRALCAHPALARTGVLRVTPFWTGADAEELDRALRADGWTVSEAEPFRSTGWVDLTRSREQILADLSKSARREVRRAERQGVTLRPVATAEEAAVFLTSLNRLRTSRGLDPMDEGAFHAGWAAIYRPGEIGTIIGAWAEGAFLGGLLVYRSRDVVHGRHFATETGALRAAGNLRISPALWLEATVWAKGKGCRWLDVEGYQEPAEGEKKFGIYKYKSEFKPEVVKRISERSRTLSPAVYLTGNARALLRSQVKRVLQSPALVRARQKIAS